MDITPDITLLTKELSKLPNKKTIQATADQLDPSKSNDELKKACDGFEELFVHKMLQVMRQSTEKSGLISGGRGEEIFQDMLDENYAQMITKTEALGLSKMIFEHTKKYL